MRRLLRWTAAVALAAACTRGVALEPDSLRSAAKLRELQAELAANPDSHRARYNLGTALLQQRRYREAREHLEKAVSATDSLVGQHAAYNAGNADLEPVFERVDTTERSATLRRAIDSYKKALLRDPNDADAKWNLELARRLLREPPTPDDPDPDPSTGGGGGGGGGGAGGSDPQSGSRDPRPQPSSGAGDQPQISPEAAERLLSSARDREAGLQRDKLRRPQPRDPFAH